MAATKVTTDRFKVSSIWLKRLGEHHISVPAVRCSREPTFTMADF
jgi:hypothetical protein